MRELRPSGLVGVRRFRSGSTEITTREYQYFGMKNRTTLTRGGGSGSLSAIREIIGQGNNRPEGFMNHNHMTSSRNWRGNEGIYKDSPFSCNLSSQFTSTGINLRLRVAMAIVNHLTRISPLKNFLKLSTIQYFYLLFSF